MPEDDIDELLTTLQNLHIEEENLINRIIAARTAEAQAPTGTTRRQPEPAAQQETVVFRVGDRVRITNRIAYFGRATTPGDRTGTVTKITEKRVYLATDSGIHTNRAPKNLTHITTDIPGAFTF
jgi:hypothetical protein